MPVKRTDAVAIFGCGVVGSALEHAYLEAGCTVRVVDNKIKPRRVANALKDASLVFVCVPTPTDYERMVCDTSAVEDVVREIFTHPRCSGCPVVIRSTVSPGTTSDICLRLDKDLKPEIPLPLLFSPEFLRAASSEEDAMYPGFSIIGSGTKSHPQASMYLARFYKDLYGIRHPVLQCTWEEAEMAKYAINSFLAVKVSFFNELYELCFKMGIQWNKVVEGILLDGRIGQSHTQVPGPDGLFGFGGACLPKDLTSLVGLLSSYQSPGHVCRGALATNREVRPV